MLNKPTKFEVKIQICGAKMLRKILKGPKEKNWHIELIGGFPIEIKTEITYPITISYLIKPR